MCAGLGWTFDVYCQLFGLVNYQAVLVFLWSLSLAAVVGWGYGNYHRLNRITTYSYLQQETQLLAVVQQVSLGGFFLCHPRRRLGHCHPGSLRDAGLRVPHALR